MPDYFTGLVTRAIGATPAARPRLPATFEPVAFEATDETAAAPVPNGAAAPREGSSPWRDTPHRSPSNERAPTDDAGRRRLPHSATVAAADQLPGPAPLAPSPPPPTEAPVATAAPAPASGVDASERDVGRRQARPEPARATGRSVTQPRSTPVPPVAQSEQEPERGSPNRGRELVPQAPAPPVGEAPAARAALLAPASPAPSRSRAEESEPGTLRPKTRQVDALPDVALAARPSRRATLPSGELLVHVSIGRVEVHAPASRRPHSASKRERAKPPTALDDYLGYRNGTRR